jgi:hypothetical protein
VRAPATAPSPEASSLTICSPTPLARFLPPPLPAQQRFPFRDKNIGNIQSTLGNLQFILGNTQGAFKEHRRISISNRYCTTSGPIGTH